MAETYIKLFRKVLENELFNEKPFDHWHAFEWLIVKACRFEKTEVVKGQVVNLKPGQLIIGQRKLSETFGWSRGKLLRFCELLKKLNMATFDSTTYKASIGTLITIENYSRYQDDVEANSTTDSTTNSTTDSTTDSTSIKKEKKDKKDKNNIYIIPALGEFGNVNLTEEELEKLQEHFPYDWQDRIDRLSEYVASKGKRYKSHYATLLSWARKEARDSKTSKAGGADKLEEFYKMSSEWGEE